MIIVDDKRNLRLVGALQFKNRLFNMPGRKEWKDDRFICEKSRANIEWLEAEFPEAEWRSTARDMLEDMRAREKTVTERSHGDRSRFLMKTTPFEHQWEALLRSVDEKYFAYLMEMGTGKTKVLIDNVVQLFRDGKILGLILVAPNGVHRQFVREQLPTHCPDDIPLDTFIYQSGGPKAFQVRKANFLKPNSAKLRVLSINVEALSHKSGVQYVMNFMKSFSAGPAVKPLMMAIDESTRIKNIGSGRSKNIRALGKFAEYRRILSGSPITRGIEDLYGQFLFLSPNVIGFNSYYTFRNRYCILQTTSTHNGADYQSIVGYQNVDELKKRIAPWSYRVKKEECLDLPPKMYVKREVPVSDQQKELYRQLRRELMLELDGLTLTATVAAAKITKLQQILCGHIRFTAEDVLKILPDVPRIEVTRELIEEAQGQIIIWARFTPDIDRLCKEFEGYGVSRYDGKVDNEGRQRSIDLFRSGQNRIFVGQPASAGLGLNLVGPETVIYYSNSFDAEHRWQSEDRNHRAGAEGKHVTYYDLIVPNSIDTYILKVLSRKQDIASMTIDDLKEMLQGDLE